MTVDIETIGIAYDTSGLEKGNRALEQNARAANKAADAADKIGVTGKRSFTEYSSAAAMAERQTRALSDATSTFTRIVGTAAVSLGGLQLIGYIDQYTKYTAQLKLATSGQTEYTNALSETRRIARESQTDLAATGVLYARITNGTKELAIGQAKVSQITEAVTLALKASGATATESSSAMLQLSQAFASGTLRGEEFNAVNEAAPRLMKALADGIGVPVGALKEMASEGKITSAIMAEALPKALAELRKEAAQVQTISGAFTVLKNNVLEFVGAQAQANGTAATISSGIELIANNLNLVTAAAGGFAAAKLAGVILDVGMATQVGIARTLEYAAAQSAQRAAAIGQAQAEVANTEAKIAGLAATNSALATSRAEAIAKLQVTNATIASAEAQIAAARSAGALSAALALVRQAELSLTTAMAARGVVMTELAALGIQQASVSASITAATAAQAAAQAGLATATGAAGAAAGLASRALGLLGGPIGAVTMLLGLGVTAWMAWGSASESSEGRATTAIQKSTAEIVDELNKQIAKLKERNALAAAGMPDVAKKGGEGAERLAQLQTQINDLASGRGSAANLPEVARNDLLQKLTMQYGQLAGAMGEVADQQKKLDAAGAPPKDQAQLIAKLSGLTTTFHDEWNTLSKMHADGTIKSVERLQQLQAELLKQQPAMKEAAQARAKGVKEEVSAEKQAVAQYEELMLSIRKRIEIADKELEYGRQLTEAEKQAEAVSALLTSGKNKLNEAAEISIRLALQESVAKEQLVIVKRELIKAHSAAWAEVLKEAEAYEKSVAGLTEQNKALREEVELIGLTEAAQLSILQSRNNILIATKQQELATLSLASAESGTMTRREIALREEIRLLEERNGLLGAKFDRTATAKAATEAADEWTKFYDGIYNGLSDSLYRGFEAGKGFFKSFWDGVKNTLKTTVLKVMVQGVMGMTGLSAPGSTGPGGMVNTASSLYSAYSALSGGGATAVGTLGTAAAGWAGATGVGAGVVGTGIGTTAAGAGAVFEGYMAAQGIAAASGATAAGVAGGIASGTAAGVSAAGAAATAGLAAIPVVGWIALAAIALYSIFGNKGGGPKTESGYTPVRGIDSVLVEDEYDRDQTGAKTISEGISGSYQALTKQLGLTNQKLDVAVFYAMDNHKNGTAKTLLQVASANYNRGERLGGIENVDRGEDALKAALAEETTRVIYAALQDSDLAQRFRDYLSELDISAGVNELQARIDDVLNVSKIADVFAQLGPAFQSIKDQAVGTTKALIEAAGGMEALGANLAAYYDNFYSAEEKRLNVGEAIKKALAGAGINFSVEQILGASRDDFREFAEAQDLSTEAGQKTFATLMSVAGAFASVTEAGNELDARAAAWQAQKQANAAAEASVNQLLSDVYGRVINRVKETIAQHRAYAKELREFRDSLLLGDESPLDAAMKIATAQGGFDAAYKAVRPERELSRSGRPINEFMLPGRKDPKLEAEAVARLQSSSETYLSTLLDSAKSMTEFNIGFASIASALSRTATRADGIATEEEAHLKRLQSAAASIPGYANGGLPSGLSMVGEVGPELVDFTTPARVYTASQTKGMLAPNTELVAEMRAMRAELRGLRAEAAATAAHTYNTSKHTRELKDRGIGVFNAPDEALITAVA